MISRRSNLEAKPGWQTGRRYYKGAATAKEATGVSGPTARRRGLGGGRPGFQDLENDIARVIERSNGRVLEAAVQADSEFSARSGHPEDAIVEMVSANPPAMVYTIAYAHDAGRGPELVEVCTTGSRPKALEEMARQPPGRTLIEETPAANQAGARGRRS